MADEIVVTTRDARQLLTEPGNPHLIWHGGQVRTVRQRAYRNFYRDNGAFLITSRAGLAAIDPGAPGIDPARLATLLTTFANDLTAS
jgi:hypothetical protein